MNILGRIVLKQEVEVGNLAERDQINRKKFKDLCQLAGSYSSAAQLIAIQTQRPLSVDSIKAWTCNPSTSRSRPCPDWAIYALERRLKRTLKIAKQTNVAINAIELKK